MTVYRGSSFKGRDIVIRINLEVLSEYFSKSFNKKDGLSIKRYRIKRVINGALGADSSFSQAGREITTYPLFFEHPK